MGFGALVGRPPQTPPHLLRVDGGTPSLFLELTKKTKWMGVIDESLAQRSRRDQEKPAFFNLVCPSNDV